MRQPLKILITPLDWGWGHTTRCLPIIDTLLKDGYSVTLAAPENILFFVKEQFPHVETIVLHGYDIKYSRYKIFFAFRIIAQIPKIIKAIKREHKWLADLLGKEHFDAIISDNRYGLYHPALKSVIMTHQLAIRSGLGAITDKSLQKLHYFLLQHFDNCWVVDEPGEKNLSGQLAHPKHLPVNSRYIGLLSQMSLLQQKIPSYSLPENDFKKNILILLSGPEPMRGILEKELLAQCEQLSASYHFHFVAGKKTVDDKNVPSGFHFKYYSRLPVEKLYPILNAADLVICRSGYSTLMDIAFLGKKTLLIPTPGQTEQEYLAKYLAEEYGIFKTTQGKITLAAEIPKALRCPPIQIVSGVPNALRAALEQFMLKDNKSIGFGGV